MARIKQIGISFFIVVIFSGCDFVSTQKTFVVATPKNDASYHYASKHFEAFLAKGGFKIKTMETANAIEANRAVAEGRADLTFIMNCSLFIPESLSDVGSNLRTILPLYTRLMFWYSKDQRDSILTRDMFRKKRIGLEILEGETQSNLSGVLQKIEVESVSYTAAEEGADIQHFWGTYYGPRAQRFEREGYIPVSLTPDWIQYLTVTNPALQEFVIHGIPGRTNGAELMTVKTSTLLVGSSKLGERAVHDLTEYIYQHKLSLLAYDRMYSSINEQVDRESLLYPMHLGADAYLRRDQPTFLERYSDSLALLISLLAIAYGAVQAIRLRMARRKKDQLDIYFLEFLAIKDSNSLDQREIEEMYDRLFHKLLTKMTDERIEKGDFHILARLIQQEFANLRLAKR